MSYRPIMSHRNIARLLFSPPVVTVAVTLVFCIALLALVVFTPPGRIWLNRVYRVYVLDELDRPLSSPKADNSGIPAKSAHKFPPPVTAEPGPESTAADKEPPPEDREAAPMVEPEPDSKSTGRDRRTEVTKEEQGSAPAKAEFIDRISGFASMLRDTDDFQAARMLLLRIVGECVLEDRLQLGKETLKQHLEVSASRYRTKRISESAQQTLIQATACYRFLELYDKGVEEVEFMPGVREWLFNNRSRLRLLVENVSPRDEWGNYARIVQQLAKYDTEQRAKYFRLILALAAVWDSQPRPPLHMHVGELPDYDESLEERYDYFKKLFESEKAGIAYERLSADALAFVVDTPGPVSELEWARNHVQGLTNNWNRWYFQIDDAPDRITDGYQPWPHGIYSLANIREHGGTRLDRAYFATLTARAHGIPAVMFESQSADRDNVAWFAYMNLPGQWTMRAGKTADDKHVNVVALVPQTNERIAGHQMVIRCQNAVTLSEPRVTAAELLNVAVLFQELDHFAAAEKMAYLAMGMQPLYEESYHFLEKVYRAQKRSDELLQLFKRKMDTYREEDPAIYAAAARQRAAFLREQDLPEKASEELLFAETVLEQRHPELACEITIARIDNQVADGHVSEALKTYERFLIDNQKMGPKILDYLAGYVELAEKTEQSGEAVSFINQYLRTLAYLSSSDRARCLELLATACENNGDRERAREVREKAALLR